MTFRATQAFTRLFSGAPSPDDHFRSLADHLDEALFLVYPRSGIIAEVNHSATVLTGYSRAELCSLSLSELIDARSAPNALEEIHSFTGSMARPLTGVPIRTYSGRPLFADLRLHLIDSTPARPAIWVFATDSRLREAAERQSKLLPGLVQSVMTLADLSLEPKESTLEDTLRVGAAMLMAEACGMYQVSIAPPRLKLTAAVGLPAAFPDELPSRDIPSLIAPAAWSSAIRPDTALSRAARSAGWGSMLAMPLGEGTAQLGVVVVGYGIGETPPAEASMVLRLFARHLYLLIGQISRNQHAARVLTELGQTSALVDSLMTQTRDAVLLVNAEHRVLRVNPTAEHMLGYDPDEFRASRIEDVMVTPHNLTFAIQEALSSGLQTDTHEIIVHRRTGEAFPASVRVSPVRESESSPQPSAVIVMVMVGDISKRKAIETRSHQLEQRALLGEVSAIFAHEVRNPLNNITAGVQLLASRLAPDHPMQDAFSKIMAECTRLSMLMKDVLDFSKPLQLQIGPNDLGAIVQRVITRWTAKMSRQQISLHCDLRPETPPALIDARSIEQVITNLVDNAIQAMPDGGTLSVALSPAPSAQNGPTVLLRITDTGIGMSDEVKRRIFDPFFTTKPTGTGLGLSITRHIISANNGSLRVESFPAIGSTFSVTLPAAAKVV